MTPSSYKTSVSLVPYEIAGVVPFISTFHPLFSVYNAWRLIDLTIYQVTAQLYHGSITHCIVYLIFGNRFNFIKNESTEVIMAYKIDRFIDRGQ
ncbi:hypothetical protein QFZ28_005968 [Neobacillus niacini]|uniref:hypothetical protein n=1 Tax=Neobacillus niacini TaxID=86668 RepID=UPI0027856650|nr:hypothetical protein [Neobacillus niacini]MDQ1005390.1 hypothetical protein [Neobacillus niacini]